jgi:outer membrane receptor protein involved in Fe transport
VRYAHATVAASARLSWSRLTALGLLVIAASASRAAAQTGAEQGAELPPVRVVAPARLPGVPLPVTSVPATVDVIGGDAARGTGAITLQDALRRLPGVTLGDQQGNTFQPDLAFRGFSVTPVTGAPQGVSVFLDGVRINEPTVEEVNFDLIPLDDVERIEIVRGPAAVYGRNTLGGAVNIVTRRGAGHAELVPAIEAGSFGRQKYRLRVGGAQGPVDYWLSGTFFREEGWRDVSAARVGTLFAKVGLARGGTDVALALQHSENRIEQPGSLPLSDLRRDRTLNFTGGDFFKPTLSAATLDLQQELGERLALSVNVFGRGLEAEQFNANLAAEDTRSFTSTTSAGGGLQLSHDSLVLGRRNRLVGGIDYAHHGVGVRVFVDGDGEDGPVRMLDTRVADDQHAVGVFLQDTLDLATGVLVPGDALIATAAARWDWLQHDIDDRSPQETGRPRAAGVSRFSHLSPRVGLNYNVSRDHGVFLAYAEGFRAPAFLELTCASPAAICPGLQAGVAPDPPLEAVKARTYELGLRARPARWLETEIALFRTDVRDDIFSVSPTGTTGLFFQNVGSTRRQGIEASARAARRGVVEAYVNYAYTEATFLDTQELATPRLTAGCAAPPCTQLVRAGNDLPLVPRHRVNAGVDWHPVPWLTASVGAGYVSEQRLRGDEENVERMLAGYVTTTAGLRLRWRALEAFVTVNNLLDDDYEVFGTFAPNGRLPGSPVEPFLTPAAPRNVLGGVSYRF